MGVRPCASGGAVLDSIPGIYDHVLVLDFKSLYPSIIRTFLVDPLGRSVATFSQPHYAATLLSQFRRITDYFESASG